jgi:hypothetical protein
LPCYLLPRRCEFLPDRYRCDSRLELSAKGHKRHAASYSSNEPLIKCNPVAAQLRMNIVMRAVERRSFLCLVAGAVALPGIPAVVWAQTYPTRPVRIVVGFAVGSALDLTARIIAQWLSERLGQSVFVENRPGAGGNLGTEIVVRAPPDGHTLLLVSSTNAISATLFKKLNFDFLRDIAPITSIVRAYQVIIVNPSRPYKTIAELISYAHDNPGRSLWRLPVPEAYRTSVERFSKK